MGLMLGHQAEREVSLTLLKGLRVSETSQALKDAAQAWIDSVSDAALSKQAAEASRS